MKVEGLRTIQLMAFAERPELAVARYLKFVEEGILNFLKRAIDDAHMKMHMLVQAGAEPVNKVHRADMQGGLVPFAASRQWASRLCAMTRKKMRSTMLSTRAVALHEVAQALWHRQHPLAHR